MIPQIGILTVIGLALMLAIYIAQWWFKRNDKTQKAKDGLDKEIKEAIASGDVSRINNVIQRLRGK